MGKPKALLPLRGRTLIDNILEAIARSSIEQTVVVVGHHRVEIEKHLGASVKLVFNPNYELGMTTSFQAGIRALPKEITGAVLFLVDHPIVDSDTIESLIANVSPDRIVLPVFEGRRGHPVLFGAAVLQEILALTASQGANIVVRKDPDRIVQVPVHAPGILVDVDTPEDFLKLQNDYEPR
jgi:molybdenum cofactor cytidylyltransferase